MVYILALSISLCLIAGQTLWASAVKLQTNSSVNQSNIELLTGLLVNSRFWIGALFYVIGTVCYFLLLSKVKFFSVQITMTGLAIILSVAVSHFILKESVSAMNAVGILLIILGIALVFNR